MTDEDSVELAEAIDVVREQLLEAQQAGQRSAAGKQLSFAVGKVTIEFAGEVKKTVGGSGGIKFWVVTADAKAEQARGASHKVTIELTPQAPGGASFTVNDHLHAPPPN